VHKTDAKPEESWEKHGSSKEMETEAIICEKAMSASTERVEFIERKTLRSEQEY